MLKEEKNYFIFKCLESEKKTHIGIIFHIKTKYLVLPTF